MSFYLAHHGVKGMKWGVRRYQNADGSYKSGADGRYNGSDIHNKKQPSNAKKIAKGAAVVAGTALAAYGMYKVAKITQDHRHIKAMRKAQSYLDDNFLHLRGNMTFSDGTKKYIYKTSDELRSITTQGPRREAGKYVGSLNAKTVSRARDIYDKNTNTVLDKGLAKVVNAGDRFGNSARKTGSRLNTSARSAGNRASLATRRTKNKVLDVVRPQYEHVPYGQPVRTVNRTVDDYGVTTVTRTKQNYVRVKRKRTLDR